MRFLLFLKLMSFLGGEWPSPRRRLPSHCRRTFACTLAGAMTLLPGVAMAYQPGQDFGQENSHSGTLLSGRKYLVPSAAVGSDGSRRTFDDGLPDAPVPAAERNGSRSAAVEESAAGVSVSPGRRPLVPLKECPYDKTKAQECRVHWPQLLISSAVFLTWQNTANAYSSYWYRHETLTGNWWERYVNSVVGYKFSVWRMATRCLMTMLGIH